MTTVQISLLISGFALSITLWARFEGFLTTRRSKMIDRIKRIGECIDLATKMLCKAEDFERLYEKEKPIFSTANSDVMKLVDWQKSRSNFKKAKEATQAFIDSAHQNLEYLKNRKRVTFSQIEMEAFLAEFQGIKTRFEHLFTSFGNLIVEKNLQLEKFEKLQSEHQILLKERDELETEYQITFNEKNQKQAKLGKPKKTNGNI